jgi:hypothetical protein
MIPSPSKLQGQDVDRRIEAEMNYWQGVADVAVVVPNAFALCTHAQQAIQAFQLLRGNVCGQGYVCTGGPKCGSDHK